MLLAQSVFTFTYHLPDTHCGRNVMLNMMRKFSALKFRTQFELYQSIDRFRLENDLPVLVSHLYLSYCVMTGNGERVCALSEGRKWAGRILIQTQTESVYSILNRQHATKR